MGSTQNAGDLVKSLGSTRVLIVTDANVVQGGLLKNLTASLDRASCKYDVYDDCLSGAPSSTVEKCSQMARNGGHDLIIGVGGGSVMDTAKAVGVMAPNGIGFQDFLAGRNIKRVLPRVLVPTTSGTGSEWSRTGVYHDDMTGKRELVMRDDLFASAAVVDPELTLNLPPKVTADTGIDALTHAIEAYVSPGANIVSDAFAESAIRLIAANLRHAYTRGAESPEARYHLAIAASMGMGATVMASSGMAHIMNSEMVKRASLTHGEACILLLPHAMRFNLTACPERMARIAGLMGEKTDCLSMMDAARKAPELVAQLARDTGLPSGMAAFGIKEADIPVMADAVIETRAKMIASNNPRRAAREDLIRTYTEAM